MNKVDTENSSAAGAPQLSPGRKPWVSGLIDSSTLPKASAQRQRSAIKLLLIMLVLLAGCGYHTAGKGAALPPDLHTIAIPTFTNVTTAYRAEQILTQAVVHEFTS